MSVPQAPPLPPSPVALQLADHARQISWSPDSRWLAAALGSGEMVIIDAAQAAIISRWRAHKQAALTVAWSPRSPIVASSGEDGWLRWWNPIDGSLIRESREKGWIEQLAWQPQGELLAGAAGRVVKVWNPEGEITFEYGTHESTIAAMVWRPDGKGLGTACFGQVQLIRLGEAKPYEDLRLKTSHISLAWSPNGRHVAAGSQENTVTYWKLPFRDKAPLHMSGYASKVRALAWDSESRFLATGGGELITVWDVSGPGPAARKPAQLQGSAARVTLLAYQQRGETLASGSLDGSVWLWNPARGGGGVRAADLGAEISCLSWSPDQRLLAAASAEGQLQIIV